MSSNCRVLITGENAAALSLAARGALSGFQTTLLADDAHGVERSHHFLTRLLTTQRSDLTQASNQNPQIIEPSSLSGTFDVLIDMGHEDQKVEQERRYILLPYLNADTAIAIHSAHANSSPPSQWVDAGRRPQVIYFPGSPLNTEIVEATKTTQKLPAPFQSFFKTLDMQVIETEPTGYFLAHRLTSRLYDTLTMLLIKGAVPDEIDDALRHFGFELGPFERQDLSGLDGPYYGRKKTRLANQKPDHAHLVPDRMVQEGRLGKKVGVGWYRYPGGGGAVVDPLLEDMIVEEARFAGILRQTITREDIIAQTTAALVDEAVHILNEQKSLSPRSLDFISEQAIHFPHGGICRFGLEKRSS